jgi:hypothetical protein
MKKLDTSQFSDRHLCLPSTNYCLLATGSRASRRGQSIAEVLVALAVGVILVGAAASLILPSLKSNTQVTNIQEGSTLAKGMLDNVRVFSEGSWNNLLALATGSAHTYFLQTGKSPFVAVSGTEAISYDGVTSGLVGWWKFDDGYGSTTIDSSGNNNTGTWNGTPIGTAGTYYAPGKVGQYAGAFDGASTYVQTNLAPSGYTGITMSAWVQLNATGSYPMILSYGTNSDNVLELRGYAGTGEIQLTARVNNVGVTDSVSVVGQGWQFFVGISNGTTFTLYKNGLLIGTSTQAHNLNSTTPFRIGNRSDGGPYSWNGLIDDVRVYNRALSPTEITQIYKDSYQRYFYLNDVYRNGSGLIASGGSTYDPSTKQVVVGYSWPLGATQTLSTYLTRNGNNVLDQTDWSGGAIASGTVTTSTNGQFATSSNIDYSTTTGSFYLSIPGY